MSQLLILFPFVLLIAVAGCEKKPPTQDNAVERGEYLVRLAGCHDCHTPKLPGPDGLPVPDDKRLLSGHPENLPHPRWSPADAKQRNVVAAANDMLTAWAGPWGVSFAANLTPDKTTGIGEWSEANFIQAMRTGKHQGQPNGRAILPPMPWFNLKDLTEADMKAMWAYLRSVPPIKNQVPFPVPPGTTAEPQGSR
jgi:mono/diheme cytochrome c family protein